MSGHLHAPADLLPMALRAVTWFDPADMKQAIIPAENRTLDRPARILPYRLSLSESNIIPDG